MAENKQDETSYLDSEGNPAPKGVGPSGDIVRDDSFFDLPPTQSPLSAQYTYTPTIPPTPAPGTPAANLTSVGNLAGEPSQSGTGQVSLPPAVPPPAQPIRENPFGGPPIPPPAPPPNPSLNPAQPPATAGQIYTPPTKVPTGPLPTGDLAKEQVNLLEQRKQLFAEQGANLSKGQAEAARIQSEAAQQDKARMEGDPVALLKAQQDHAEALRLPDTDPNKRAKIQQAEFDIRSNEGARSSLLRAQMDAERRDNEIRAMIRKAQDQKIDPDRWWNNKSTGAKVLAGIGMILGGMGGGLARTGRNPALDVMNNAINEDINAQRHDIDNQWKAIAEQHNLNNDSFNRELHRQVWENNYRTAALERVKLDLAANAARTESQTVKNNAQLGIQDLTNEQLKIRNQQYILAVQAASAEMARLRNLQKEAQADVMKLVEKEGVQLEDAERSVYSSPRYADIMSQAPAHVRQEANRTNALVAQYKIDAANFKRMGGDAGLDKNAKALGLKPGTPQYDAYINENNPDKNPRYNRLFSGERERPIGAVVAPDLNKRLGAEEKSLDIQKKTEEIRATSDEKKAMADIYSRALAYQDYFSKAQAGDIKAQLPFTRLGGEGGAYNRNIDSWNTFVDTTLAPVMEKAFVSGKPGQQSLHVAKERYHIEPGMTDAMKKQIMTSAIDNLNEAMKIGGVKTQDIKPTNIPSLSGSSSAPITFTPDKK